MPSSKPPIILENITTEDSLSLELYSLSLSGLTHLCRQTTDSFFKGEPADYRFCFELFRRALQEEDQLAWYNIIDQYNYLVTAWVRRHPCFSELDEEIGYFVSGTFANFWLAFNRDPNKFPKFGNLKSLLHYLKLCAYTAVQDYARRRRLPQYFTNHKQSLYIVHQANNDTERAGDDIDANLVWQHVLAAVNTNQERIVAEMSFVYDMKPQEIYRRHQNEFSNTNEVRRVKGNFLTRLRRNKQLVEKFNGMGYNLPPRNRTTK